MKKLYILFIGLLLSQSIFGMSFKFWAKNFQGRINDPISYERFCFLSLTEPKETLKTEPKKTLKTEGLLYRSHYIPHIGFYEGEKGYHFKNILALTELPLTETMEQFIPGTVKSNMKKPAQRIFYFIITGNSWNGPAPANPHLNYSAHRLIVSITNQSVPEPENKNYPTNVGMFEPHGITTDGLSYKIEIGGIKPEDVNFHGEHLSHDRVKFNTNKQISTFWTLIQYGEYEVVTLNIMLNTPELEKSFETSVLETTPPQNLAIFLRNLGIFTTKVETGVTDDYFEALRSTVTTAQNILKPSAIEQIEELRAQTEPREKKSAPAIKKPPVLEELETLNLQLENLFVKLGGKPDPSKDLLLAKQLQIKEDEALARSLAE